MTMLRVGVSCRWYYPKTSPSPAENLICVKSCTVRLGWNGGAMEYVEITFYLAMGIAAISMTAAVWALLRWR
jgi:hypothetical protein